MKDVIKGAFGRNKKKDEKVFVRLMKVELLSTVTIESKFV